MRGEARWSIGKILAVVTVIALAIMWVYILSGAADRQPADTLDDPSFAAAAEPICASTRAAIDRLPPATEAPDAVARADVVDEANDLLRAMVARLRQAVPDNPNDANVLGLWLDDWETYIGDRQDWADELRVDSGARFFETARSGEQISAAIDNLAGVNDMPSCATTDDV